MLTPRDPVIGIVLPSEDQPMSELSLIMTVQEAHAIVSNIGEGPVERK